MTAAHLSSCPLWPYDTAKTRKYRVINSQILAAIKVENENTSTGVGDVYGGFLPNYFLWVLIRSKSFNCDGIIIQYLYLISPNSGVMLDDTKPNNSKRLMIAKQI